MAVGKRQCARCETEESVAWVVMEGNANNHVAKDPRSHQQWGTTEEPEVSFRDKPWALCGKCWSNQ